MTSHRSLIAAALAALAASVLAAPAHAQTEKTSIALPAIALIFSSIYIAQDAGIFKQEGLEVKEQMITGIGAANAVISGSIDFSSSSGVTLTRAAARHQPLIAIAQTFDRSGFWIVIRKDVAEQRHFDPKAPLADRAKIMKGLRFAVGAINAIPHAYLKAIAKIGGLDGEKDIVVAGMSPPDQVGALERNAIDGFSGGPPVTNEVVLNGSAVVLANGTTGDVDPPWMAPIAANVVMARPQFCADHRYGALGQAGQCQRSQGARPGLRGHARGNAVDADGRRQGAGDRRPAQHRGRLHGGVREAAVLRRAVHQRVFEIALFGTVKRRHQFRPFALAKAAGGLGHRLALDQAAHHRECRGGECDASK
jgi:ABC-type nitrate/sulfonate/bicarbonate transport system substrate-binding protein